MDSTLVQAVQENTQSVLVLTGSLWIFGGLLCVMLCGYLIVRYTLRG